MKKVDYIIVGLGIAGIAFCEEALKKGKSILVFDDGKLGATARSGGILNPIILKRFTAFWNNPEFYPVATSFYFDLSKKLKLPFFEKTSILRVFKSIEEQNNWSVACDKTSLKSFLDPRFLKNTNPSVKASLGFGKVDGTFCIDTAVLIQAYREYLESMDAIALDTFDYDSLVIENGEATYKNFLAKTIIFCEGISAERNPFFPKNALIPNKGEYLIINAKELKLEKLLKGPVYIIPLGEDLYKVGATYAVVPDGSPVIADAKGELLEKLKSMLHCDFEVVDHTVGVRPTTKDRRPLIGRFSKHPELAFLNGLGTHGFLMAPLLSKLLYANLENGAEIPMDIDIRRL